MSPSQHTVNREGPIIFTSPTVNLKAKLREVISYYDYIVHIDGSTNQETVLQQHALSRTTQTVGTELPLYAA
jgi:hypothetical protein